MKLTLSKAQDTINRECLFFEKTIEEYVSPIVRKKITLFVDLKNNIRCYNIYLNNKLHKTIKEEYLQSAIKKYNSLPDENE